MADSIYAPSANEANGNSNGHGDDGQIPLTPHPYLKQPLLYISGIGPHTEDKDLASGPFQKLLPIRWVRSAHAEWLLAKSQCD